MKTCRFTDNQYIAAGSTRSQTKKTVAMSPGTYTIQTCPFPEVDAELEYICRMAKQWIRNWRNPFASACWTHQILVSCHPFDDGNGRLARIITSIPLMQHGFPPMSVTFNQRSDYYSGIRQGHEGDYAAMVECIVFGMRESLEVIRSIFIN
ncbi:hypothetical protein HYPSUDRAFT_126006 [Hypholoma sublateritium FD-334 SS-4]|uniref:Fido domain-containing protein n=1 Tax=Hypholoma sublateritium (strain FD-334 SS-4) TaxID=945553 RepID=A0A0D2PPS9_HYPSF|nr:hypothetical protein HYPSUDRAFT_126006 [Hypholoma sublateritium FD-334 SS-4]